jgi:hypothetical protein
VVIDGKFVDSDFIVEKIATVKLENTDESVISESTVVEISSLVMGQLSISVSNSILRFLISFTKSHW